MVNTQTLQQGAVCCHRRCLTGTRGPTPQEDRTASANLRTSGRLRGQADSDSGLRHTALGQLEDQEDSKFMRLSDAESESALRPEGI